MERFSIDPGFMTVPIDDKALARGYCARKTFGPNESVKLIPDNGMDSGPSWSARASARLRETLARISSQDRGFLLVDRYTPKGSGRIRCKRAS